MNSGIVESELRDCLLVIHFDVENEIAFISTQW